MGSRLGQNDTNISEIYIGHPIYIYIYIGRPISISDIRYLYPISISDVPTSDIQDLTSGRAGISDVRY